MRELIFSGTQSTKSPWDLGSRIDNRISKNKRKTSTGMDQSVNQAILDSSRIML